MIWAWLTKALVPADMQGMNVSFFSQVEAEDGNTYHASLPADIIRVLETFNVLLLYSITTQQILGIWSIPPH